MLLDTVYENALQNFLRQIVNILENKNSLTFIFNDSSKKLLRYLKLMSISFDTIQLSWRGGGSRFRVNCKLEHVKKSTHIVCFATETNFGSDNFRVYILCIC